MFRVHSLSASEDKILIPKRNPRISGMKSKSRCPAPARLLTCDTKEIRSPFKWKRVAVVLNHASGLAR